MDTISPHHVHTFIIIKMKLLTIFTPTYNRKHTISRTYESLCRQTSKNFEWLIIDDGSTDDTREWVENLGEKFCKKGRRFDWMGRAIDGEDENHFSINLSDFRLTYIYKPNGGLYTGYNAAYATIKTELCVCIDSDDFMPDDAVEMICTTWNKYSKEEKERLAGIAGLDFNVVNQQAIGGIYNTDKEVDWIPILHHSGDSKFVFRTALMRAVAPQIGFEGEKDFNPHYMQMQVLDKLPMVILNKNLCWVEYQIGSDSMSQAIFKQYIRSPKSYAKYRVLEMGLQKGNSFLNKLRLCTHYVSSCIFARDGKWMKNCPLKIGAIVVIPFAVALSILIKYKAYK